LQVFPRLESLYSHPSQLGAGADRAIYRVSDLDEMLGGGLAKVP
jgi:circadian clock protein KaiC